MGRKNTTKKEGRFEKIVERTWGGEYTKQYIDDMLQNYTPETYT